MLYNKYLTHAGVMELVDVLDSKSSAARRAGSSPATGTTSSRTSYRSRRRFLFQSKRRLSFTPSLFLSNCAPLRWARSWFPKCARVSILSTRPKNQWLASPVISGVCGLFLASRGGHSFLKCPSCFRAVFGGTLWFFRRKAEIIAFAEAIFEEKSRWV